VSRRVGNTKEYRQSFGAPDAPTTPRGFYLCTYGGRKIFVRKGFHLVECDGIAHKEPLHYDNCGTCMPNWGIVAIPLAVGTLADHRNTMETARQIANAMKTASVEIQVTRRKK